MGIGIGARIGSYRITGRIGAGGMGEVYRATDERLGRDVAIKVLTELSREDPGGRERFEREARLLASINHPHIGAIYGVEDIDGIQALVLELVDGPTLAMRLRDGPLPVETAITIAKQVADALEAAHGKGIIHRDLKPGNVILAPSGQAKVLDFGLAKAIDSATIGDSTRTGGLTREGTVMGTAAYMSPEQARGMSVNEQADIWAFGCVLFEMLTGKRAFDGQTTSDVIAAILKGEPDWSLIPRETPANVERVMRRCLHKDPKRRLHSIADARLDLDDRTAPAAPPERHRPGAIYLIAAAVVVAAIVVGGYAASSFPRRDPAPPSLTRFAVATSGTDFIDGGGVAVSGDGKTIAYIGVVNGVRRVAVRRLDQVEPQHLAGTEGATQPFFSPDGQWIGFFTGGQVRKIPVHGGTSEVIADAPSPRGGAWGPDDTIVFAPRPDGPLLGVAASGGKASPVTTLGEREGSHRYPQFLPGGKAIVYAAGPPGTVVLWSEASIIAQSLTDPGRRSVIAKRGTTPRYLSPGHVVYVQLTRLFAVPIDIATVTSTGVPVELDENVAQVPSGFAQYDLAPNGTLVSVPSSFIASGALALVDRNGVATPLNVRAPFQSEPRISPDGSKIAYTAASPDAEVWIYDINQRSARQLTNGGGNVWPAWSPDGRRIAYGSFRSGQLSTFIRDLDGGPEHELALRGGPQQWLPGSRTIALHFASDIRNQSLIEDDGTAAREMPALGPRDRSPSFSPDGTLVAAVSSEAGRDDVVIYPYPGPGERLQVSPDGGAEPVFSRDGRAVFYRRGTDMMMVDVTPGARLRVGRPRLLFRGTSFSGAGNRANFDVMPDGQRFLMVQLDQTRPPLRLVITERWQESIRASLER